MWYYLNHIWGNKGVPTFREDISPKVNKIAWEVFELISFEAVIKRFRYYTTRIQGTMLCKYQLSNVYDTL